ncbi:hypothetical protein ACTXT7_002513 [Hymenolepis weldensis]
MDQEALKEQVTIFAQWLLTSFACERCWVNFKSQFLIGTLYTYVEAQFGAYEIINQKVPFTCLLNGLTPEIAELVYDVLEKSSTTPYNDLKFTVLERMEVDDSSSIIDTPRKGFDAEQFRLDNREPSEELPFIAGDSDSK